ncbi:DUF1330 domain-containing protein [uncultured Roseibium sp.]|uniref:DUF1330 domain-containing protein n=1 Tax=uncultured Roseibium sp. TaxID=1936171 RepID=UPI00261866FA|nr:DUF1330 domain-containing protein [uncultured Roseibium sp.]
MPVLNFSYTTIKDMAAFKEYLDKASVLMQRHDVETVVRRTYRTAFRSTSKGPHFTAVSRYEDMESAMRFYQSVAYRNLIELRNAASEMEIQFHDE